MAKSTPWRWALLTTVLFVLGSAFAQEVPQRPGAIADGYLAFGSGVYSSTQLTPEEWRGLLPNSAILLRDVPDNVYFGPQGPYAGPSSGYYLGSSGSVVFGIGVDLGRNNEAPRLAKRLRVGATYTDRVSSFDTWGGSASARYDTLVSQSTGQHYYRDTTYAEWYGAELSWSRIGLDLSYLVRRTSASRWAWYLGVGGQFGALFNTEARLSHQVSRSDIDASDANAMYAETIGTEHHRLRSTMWGATHALAGIEFVLGRKSQFLSNLHVFYEFRPTLTFSAPGGSAMQAQGSAQHFFGLRFDLR